MQNEPNLQNAQMDLTSVKTKGNENKLTFARRQNEPNTNPIQNQFTASMLFWPAVRMLSTYSGQALRNTAGSSFRLPAKTAYLYRVTNKKMQNEPNFKNTQMNLSPVKTKNYENIWHCRHRKNEPNLWKTNPIQTQSFIERLSCNEL